MSRSSVLASLASQDVSASEFDKLDADNGSDYQGQIDLKSPLASPTFTGSITTPEIRSGSTLTIDPATVGDNTGLVLLKGNLQVDGTSTTINSTTLTVDDLNLTLASGAADSAAANGAGITIDGASATMTYTHSTTSFDFNKPVNAINTAQVTGAEGTSASLYLVADEGDDNGDGWRINSNQDVNDLTISNNTSGSYVDKLTLTSTGNLEIAGEATVTNKLNSSAGNSLTLQSPTGGAVIINTNGANERVRVTSAGNVGIGTTPASGKKFHVSGDTQIDGNLALVGNNKTISPNNSGAGYMRIFGGGTNEGGAIEFRGGGNSGDLRFLTGTSGAGTERMRIDSGGKVGIGTASPYKTVTLSKNIGGTKADLLDIQSSVAGGGTQPMIRFGTWAANSNTIGRIGFVDIPNYGGGFVVETNSTGSATDSTTEKFRVDKDGNVGIGTTSPTSGRLEVHNDNGSLPGIRIKDTDSSPTYSNRFIRFSKADNAEIGYIAAQGSSVAYVTSSDYRLKENVTLLTGAIDRLNQLKPSRFNFITDPENTVDGFLAHEVSDIVPEAVSGEKDAVNENGDIEPQGIDQSKLVPLLVASIQELSAKVTALENAS